MATHNVSISIKVLTTGISIDINTESPQTTIPPIKTEKTLNLDDYEGLKKLLPLYDDNIITHTECAIITADEDYEETNTIGIFVDEDNDEEETDDDEEETDDNEEETDDDEETIAIEDFVDEDVVDDSDEETDDDEEQTTKIPRLN